MLKCNTRTYNIRDFSFTLPRISIFLFRQFRAFVLFPFLYIVLGNKLLYHNFSQGNAILEVRAGTGGGEAQLFAKEIFEMYKSYPFTYNLFL